MNYKKSIDLSTITGIVASFIIIILAISSKYIHAFLDFKSFILVICGTLCTTMACYSTREILASIPTIFEMILFRLHPLSQIAIESLKYAEFARKYNLIKLEDLLNSENNFSLLSKGISLINQNEKIENIEKILNQEILTLSEEKENTISILRKAGEISPAMGLIGTLIGLVQMLGNLNNPSDLGSSMAIALLTTFYGAILSYMLLFPIASKIEQNLKNEIITAQIYLKTIISISKNENPRYLENTINSLLDSSGRINFYP